MSKIYLEIFDNTRQEVFSFLSKFREIGYLSGGTALALQVKHRKSFDFDVFLQKPINNRIFLEVRRTFPDMQLSIHTEDQLSFTTQKEIGITFLWYYFSPLYPLVTTPSLPLASLFDIAADKAYTMGRRALWRDYIDLYTFLKRGIINLERLIALSKKKFTNDFNESLFLEQLVYFNDVEVTPIAFIGKAPTKKEVTSFLEKKVLEYLKEKILK